MPLGHNYCPIFETLSTIIYKSRACTCHCKHNLRRRQTYTVQLRERSTLNKMEEIMDSARLRELNLKELERTLSRYWYEGIDKETDEVDQLDLFIAKFRKHY